MDNPNPETQTGENPDPALKIMRYPLSIGFIVGFCFIVAFIDFIECWVEQE
jgi:hypothetical protein